MAKKSKATSLTSNSVSVDDEWQAKDDMRTLIEAARINKDKGRLARAKAAAKKQLAETLEATKLLSD
jgi:hypothetical protein